MTLSRAKVAQSEQLSVIAGIALAVARALEHAGVNSAQVFAKAGLNRPLTNDPLHRISVSEVSTLYTISLAATGDPYFGLKVARCIQPSNLHVLGYSLISSATLLDFCQKLVRFLAVASQSAHAELYTSSDAIELRFDHRAVICAQSEDAFLGFLIRLLRVMRSDHFTPLTVRLHHPCPKTGAAPYVAMFGVTPEFDSATSALVFSSHGAEIRLTGACAEMAMINDRLACDYIARLKTSDLTTIVRATVTRLLSTGACNRAIVAAQLSMSESTLQSRLAKCKTSFNDIIDSVRKEVAISLLRQSDQPITSIAFDLGFSETGNFTRAFRRWTDQSPTEFRASENAVPLR